jgi:hypothetical protein
MIDNPARNISTPVVYKSETIRVEDLERGRYVVGYGRVAEIEKYGLRVKVWFTGSYPDRGDPSRWVEINAQRGDKADVLAGF